MFNYRHAYKLVFEYIETFYNTVRIHSHCGYLSPNQYEAEYLTTMAESVAALAG
ncbi:MAG: IS3 family transposase [Anaerobutyricum hallii]